MAKLSAENRKWRAQDDIRTVAAAEQITKDPQRVSAMKSEVKKQLALVESAVSKKTTTKTKKKTTKKKVRRKKR